MDRLGLERDAEVCWGEPDRDALYEFALRFELSESEAFPREIAAMVSLADGLAVEDTAILRPIADWHTSDDGLEVGSGTSAQGNLTLLEGPGPLIDWRVVDRDDDGETLNEFASLGAFLDVLLGRK